MRRATKYIIGSNLLSQIIVVGSTPFLTRIYSKADFGWFGVGTTLAILMATIMSLRLEHSIHFKQSQASVIYTSCLITILAISLCFFTPLVWITQIKIVDSVVSNSWFVLLFGVGHAIHSVTTIFLNARQRFRSIAIITLVIPTVFVLGALQFADSFETINALIAWQSIAYFVGASLGLILNSKHIVGIGVPELIKTYKDELDGIRYLMPSSLISILTLNLPVLVTTALFSDSVAGLIVIAQRIARAPISVVGNGLNEVLRSTIPARVGIYNAYRKVTYACFLLSIVMITTVCLVPENTYLWLLGDQWGGLKIVLIATVFGAVFQLIATSVICLLSSFNKRQEFFINGALLLVGLLAVMLSIFLTTTNLTYLWLHVILSAFVYAVSFKLSRHIALNVTDT